jgi:preprotein translocase subunit SecB
MQILGQFIRDMSFENILSQKPVEGQVQPDIQVQVSIDAKKRDEPRYEVVTKFKISSTNKDGGETLFLMELDYAGLFAIEGVPDNQLHPFLLIECPRMLFPFVRRIVSDVTRDGGFPPLNLDNIDFMKLYRQTLEQRQAAAKAAETAEPSEVN